MITCPNCGEEVPDRFRLCGCCGTPHTVREARELHDGTIEKYIGDAILAVFGLPTARFATYTAVS